METTSYIQVTNTVSLPSPPGGNIAPNLPPTGVGEFWSFVGIVLVINALSRTR